MDHFEEAMSAIAIRGAKNGGPTIQDVLIALQAQAQDADDTATTLVSKVEDTAKTLHKEVVSAAVQRSKDIEAGNARVEAMLQKHLEWTDAVPMKRLAALEKSQAQCPELLVDMVKPLISASRLETEKEHLYFHNEHIKADHTHLPRRAEDPVDADHHKERDEGLDPLIMNSGLYDATDRREQENMRTSFRVGRYILATLVLIGLTVLVNYFVLYRGQQTQLNQSKHNNSDLVSLVKQQHQDTADLLILLHKDIDRQVTPTPTPTTTP